MSDSSCPPISITEPKLLLTEGVDAYWFCIWAYQAYGLKGIQVINFEGKNQFGIRLKTIREIPGFEQNAKAIVVVRDAETCASAQADSIRRALDKAGFPVPNEAFKIAEGNPKTAFVLFPGLDDAGKLLPAGTLEDLCLATVEDQGILKCVDSFLLCCEEAGAGMRHRHKMKLHAYLAGHDKFVGKKIGEAAAAGAWNWQHSRLKPFEDIFRQL